MVFGDIHLQEHRDWVERVCHDLGIKAIEPLWGKKMEDILNGFVKEGFEAVIVSAQSDLVDKDWIGRRVDKAFMEYLKNKDIDICGENGEYHTIVTSGPIFNRRIRLIESKVISRNNYWFLDTIRYDLGHCPE